MRPERHAKRCAGRRSACRTCLLRVLTREYRRVPRPSAGRGVPRQHSRGPESFGGVSLRKNAAAYGFATTARIVGGVRTTTQADAPPCLSTAGAMPIHPSRRQRVAQAAAVLPVRTSAVAHRRRDGEASAHASAYRRRCPHDRCATRHAHDARGHDGDTTGAWQHRVDRRTIADDLGAQSHIRGAGETGSR